MIRVGRMGTRAVLAISWGSWQGTCVAGGAGPWIFPRLCFSWALREGTDILVKRETRKESEKLSWRPSQPAAPQSQGGNQNFQLSVTKSVYSTDLPKRVLLSLTRQLLPESSQHFATSVMLTVELEKHVPREQMYLPSPIRA